MNPEWCPETRQPRHQWRPVSPLTRPRLGIERGMLMWLITVWCKHCERPALVKMFPDTEEIFIRVI